MCQSMMDYLAATQLPNLEIVTMPELADKIATRSGIDVNCDGPGIPRAHWTYLFLAFRSRSRGSTGLGLAIARDLAVAQGGNLKLTRSTEEGSEFRLQLPVEIFAAEDLPSATAPDDRG